MSLIQLCKATAFNYVAELNCFGWIDYKLTFAELIKCLKYWHKKYPRKITSNLKQKNKSYYLLLSWTFRLSGYKHLSIQINTYWKKSLILNANQYNLFSEILMDRSDYKFLTTNWYL